MKRGMKIALATVMACSMVLILGLASSTEAAPPIKLGVNSAWDYAGGNGVKRGMTMAIRDINAAGGLLGRKVEGIFYDNKCDSEEAKKATERLLYRDKVDAVAGFWRSDLVIVCQPLVMEAKKILLIGGASTPVVTHERISKDYETNKYTFTTQSNSFYVVKSLEQSIIMCKQLGLNKLAIIGEKAAWYDPVHDLFLKKYADMIVYKARFSPDATDYTVLFTKAKAAGANSVFFVCTGKGGTPSVKQWYDMQLPMLYIGYNVEAQDPNFWKITEGKCEGVQTTKVGAAGGLAITEKSRPWYEDYKKMFGEYPIAYTNAVSYDIVMAWAEAVKLAGTVDSDAVVKAFESDKFHYVGVSGVIERFDKIHNPVGGGWEEGDAWGWVSLQWQAEKQQVIWPHGVKTADMIIPERVKKLMGK